MDESELARRIAADLGPDVLAAIDNPIPTGTIPPGDATRALGLAEAMAVASFGVSCIGVAIEIWKAR